MTAAKALSKYSANIVYVEADPPSLTTSTKSSTTATAGESVSSSVPATEEVRLANGSLVWMDGSEPISRSTSILRPTFSTLQAKTHASIHSHSAPSLFKRSEATSLLFVLLLHAHTVSERARSAALFTPT